MKRMYKIAALATAGLILSACATDPGSSGRGSKTYRQGNRAAERACMAAVNRQYGGRQRNLRVINSEFSQAGSLVRVEADGEHWRCLASNDGTVEELSLAGGGSVHHGGSTPHGGPGDLIGMGAGDLKGEMARRGFHNKGGYKTDQTRITNWWNPRSRECIQLETRQGRVIRAEAAHEMNCNSEY